MNKRILLLAQVPYGREVGMLQRYQTARVRVTLTPAGGRQTAGTSDDDRMQNIAETSQDDMKEVTQTLKHTAQHDDK